MTVDIKPRKRFGQHFLQDPFILDGIVKTIAPKPENHLVEIGPGLGVLTEKLVGHCGRLDVIEIDWDLTPLLKERFGHLPHFHLHQADALKFDFRKLYTPPKKLRVVGNLPYNISTPLLFHLFEQREVILDMHFLLQKEVVERLIAEPGSKMYGRLSVMAQFYCRIEKRFSVKPGAFFPPPRVMSAFVRLIPHEKPQVEVGEIRIFAEVVAKAFSKRRKTLKNALFGLLSGQEIERAGIDSKKRPEQLTLEEFAILGCVLEAKKEEGHEIPA